MVVVISNTDNDFNAKNNHNSGSKISNNRDFLLEELRSQFDRELNIHSTTDTKTNNMITMVSAIASFIIALGTFLLTTIINKNFYLFVPVAILLTAIGLAIIGIFYFIKSYSIRVHYYPIGHEKFIQIDMKNRKIDPINSEIDKLINEKPEDFQRTMIIQYFAAIGVSAFNNTIKAKYMKYGQICFIGSIITIAMLLIVIIIFYSFEYFKI